MENNCEGKDLPTIRITAIWGKNTLDGIPPKEIAMKAAEACCKLLASLGFNKASMGCGSLENCIKNSAESDKTLMDDSTFKTEATIITPDGTHVTPQDRLDALNAEVLEKKVTASKITVEDMLRGIDLNKTCEDK